MKHRRRDTLTVSRCGGTDVTGGWLLGLVRHGIRNDTGELTRGLVLTVLMRTGGGRAGPGRVSWCTDGGAGEDYRSTFEARSSLVQDEVTTYCVGSRRWTLISVSKGKLLLHSLLLRYVRPPHRFLFDRRIHELSELFDLS